MLDLGLELFTIFDVFNIVPNYYICKQPKIFPTKIFSKTLMNISERRPVAGIYQQIAYFSPKFCKLKGVYSDGWAEKPYGSRSTKSKRSVTNQGRYTEAPKGGANDKFVRIDRSYGGINHICSSREACFLRY